MAISTTEEMEFSSNEDYLENEIHSPTDSSEDSVEVKVCPISVLNRRNNKHPDFFVRPLKKRMYLQIKKELNDTQPFRPWSPNPKKTINSEVDDVRTIPPSKCIYQSNLFRQAQFSSYSRSPSPPKMNETVVLLKKYQNENIKFELNATNQDLRVPMHPEVQNLSTAETEKLILKTTKIFPPLHTTINSTLPTNLCYKKNEFQKREQRNYKNMTRERRIEANARERTRVHTISAAFDTLRKSIPSYSHNQKLSKLSVLRIACSYIMTLSSIVDSSDEECSVPSTALCVDMVSKTIQREGKLRKKKDDND